jgi:hypothetical protein
LLLKTITSLKNKGSTGFDGVSNRTVKALKNELLIPLQMVINDSLETGYVPEELKEAKVIPLYKSGLANDFSNYRPISLLNVFSKILEKCVYFQLYDYFAQKIMTKTQFGFRKGAETLHCITSFLRNMDTDDPSFRAAVFIDLKKAFDTVSHKILIRKLQLYGLAPTAVKWIESYLTGRSQKVLVNGCISDRLWIDCGVPQGSILGPLLFLIFINDLPDATSLFTSLFADDTTFQESGASIAELQAKLQISLNLAANWFDANQLTLHPNKTRYILFNSRGKSLDIYLKGIKLKQIANHSEERSFKFLGVHIDELLNWSYHISHVASKLNKIYFALTRIKNYFPLKLKIGLYNALFKSHLEYCVPIWGHAKGIAKIEKIQKRMIRSLFYGKGFAHTEPLLKKHGLLKFRDIYYKRTAQVCYKLLFGFAPESVKNIITLDESSRRRGEALLQGKPTPISFKLPNYLFSSVWNMLRKDEHTKTCLTFIPYTPKFLADCLSDFFLDNYYEKCTLVECFFCNDNSPTPN